MKLEVQVNIDRATATGAAAPQYSCQDSAQAVRVRDVAMLFKSAMRLNGRAPPRVKVEADVNVDKTTATDIAAPEYDCRDSV